MTTYTLTYAGVEYVTNRPAGLTDTTTDPVVIGVHGDSRDHIGLLSTLTKAAGTRKALIVCPLFRTASDPVKAGLDVWSDDGWKRGDPSSTGQSSFAVIEAFRERTNRNVTLAGHSAGGQFLQRWAYFGVAPCKIVVANPGSFMWHTTQWSYKYGLANLPGYCKSRPFGDRPFTLLLGTMDTDMNDPTLDKSKAAMWQGDCRYDRGRFYAKDHGATYIDVPGVGHTASGMFRSAQGVKAIFG